MNAKTIPLLSDRQLLEQIYAKLIELEQKDSPVKPSSDWISEKDAAKILELSPDTIRKYRYDGTLTKVKASPGGRKVRVSLKECEQKLQIRIA